jgi:trehalose synthase
VGGIKAQIQDGVSGFLVDDMTQCASRIVQLFEMSELRDKIGKAAKDSVRSRFLLPRLLRDYLQVFMEHEVPYEQAAEIIPKMGD